MDVSQLFFNYGAVVLEFLLEFEVFCVLMTSKLTRRPHFWKKLILATASLLVVSIGVAAFYTLFGDSLWGRILVYIVLFVLVSLEAAFLFDEPVGTILYCTTASYAMQNLAYKAYLSQYLFGKALGWYAFPEGAGGQILFRLMYYGVFALVVTIVWFAFIRRMRSRTQFEMLTGKGTAIALLILGLTVILCSLEDIYFEKVGVSVESALVFSDLFLLRETGNLLSIIACITVLVVMDKTLVQKDLLREINQLQYEIKQSEKQYQISKDTIDMINIKCHDMKYKLDAAIGGSGASSEAFDDVRRSIEIYDSNIATGNKLLNVLFTEKSLYCKSHDIKLTCMIDGSKLDFIDDGDLYCLFGNVLDNALEAVMQIKEKAQRIINIVVRAQENMVIVQEENYFMGSLKTENGAIVTTKQDKNYHGFGTRSIAAIAHRYGGEVDIATKGQIFTLTILFPNAGKANSKGEDAQNK
ncbi:MAG: GHKL domain-containing protein [Bacilli bacterium]|nr:GHKL domain-containing protein [Bacilli bacterium]